MADQTKLSAEDQQKKKQDAIQMIYNQVNEIIGAGDQLFCMMFPGQPLNQKKFDYDTSSFSSVLTKPWLVEEEEFRLSEQLFDLSPIVQATNGKKLSSVYQTLINNYLPKLNELAHYFKDRAGLAGFLLEDSGKKDESGKSLTRIDLCKKLYKEYLVAKNDWEVQKRNKLLKVKADNKNQTKEERDAALDDYANWHSSEAAVKDAELDNLYNDLVITGHFHEVMTLLGYLNAASVAEELERCKQKMRHSQRVSLDESMDIFPVQFIPNNWAKALTPNLHPEDLTMSQDVLVGELRAKRKELSRLKEQLKELELLHVSEEQVRKLEQDVAGAKEAFNKAEGELAGKYGQSAIDAVKIFINAETGGTYGLFEAIGHVVKKEEDKGKDSIIKTIFKAEVAEQIGIDLVETPINMLQQVADELVGVYTAQKDTVDKAKQLTELQGKLAQYKSQDMDLQKLRLQEQINSLQDDVDYVGGMVPVVYAQNKKFKDDGQYQEFDLVKVETTQEGEKGKQIQKGIQTIDVSGLADKDNFRLKFGNKDTGQILKSVTQQQLTTELTNKLDLKDDHIKVEKNGEKITVTFSDDYCKNNNNITLFTTKTAGVEITPSDKIIDGKNAQQKITIDSNVSSGTFKLKFGEKTTDNIDISNDDNVKSALNTLFVKDNVDVSGNKTNGWTVVFTNEYANQAVDKLKVDPGDINFKDNKNNDLRAVIDNRPSLNVLPAKRTITAEDGLFTDITISIKEGMSYQTSTQGNTASNTNVDTSAWLASAAYSSSQSNAVSKQEALAFKSKIDIGFRVAKVTFDRGWFNPQIFDLASNGDFYRLSELRAGSTITKADINKWQKNGQNILEEIEDHLKYNYTDSSNKSQTGHYMLPAYPVAMIIAKDVTFKIEIDGNQSGELNETMKESSSYGGGFLGFHFSHASSSSSSSQSTYHGQQGNHYYIRMPGPQILGYTLQFVPPDNTELKPSLTGGDDKLTFVQALQDFDSYASKMFPHGNGNGNGLKSLPNARFNQLMANSPYNIEQPHFDIIGLTNGTEVGPTHPVGGVISDTDAQIYVITHVVGLDTFDVDGPTKPKANGEWSCNVSFGRTGTHTGKDIEIMAVANPSPDLSINKSLSDWPEGKYCTEKITVKRNEKVTV